MRAVPCLQRTPARDGVKGLPAMGPAGAIMAVMDAAEVAKLPLVVASLAFVLAFVFGAVANRVNFCTMGAIADIVNFGNWHRMRMWVLAIAVAIVGSAILALTGHFLELNVFHPQDRPLPPARQRLYARFAGETAITPPPGSETP